MEIRQAGAGDAETIERVINRAFVVEEFFVDGSRTSVGEILRKMESGVFLLAEDAGVVVGSVYVELRAEQRTYVGLLAVEPSRTGAGLGSHLMRAAEDWSRRGGAAAVDITVVSVRTELFPFYESLGYRKKGELPFTDRATKVPCHFVLMRKPL